LFIFSPFNTPDEFVNALSDKALFHTFKILLHLDVDFKDLKILELIQNLDEHATGDRQNLGNETVTAQICTLLTEFLRRWPMPLKNLYILPNQPSNVTLL